MSTDLTVTIAARVEPELRHAAERIRAIDNEPDLSNVIRKALRRYTDDRQRLRLQERSRNGRKTATGLLDVKASCHQCHWASSARNAFANAARHHDAHGHAVEVEVTRIVRYGDPAAPLPGQLTIEGA